MYVSLALLILSFLTLVVARFTAKQNKPDAPTLMLTVLMILSVINLVIVGVSFVLHRMRGKNTILNITNIVVHVLLLVFMIVAYFMNRSKTSGLSNGMLIVSTLLFVASIPMTLLYLFSGATHQVAEKKEPVQDSLIQVDKKLPIEQTQSCNFDAMALLKQMQKRADELSRR